MPRLRISDGVGGRIGLFEGNAIGFGHIWCQVERVTEASGHGRGAGVHLVHGRQTEHQLNRAHEAGLVVAVVNDSVAARVRTGHVGGRSITADMVPTGLRIVFNAENAGVFPELAVAHGFNYFSQRQIVVRRVSGWRGQAGFRSRGVIAGQVHHH